MKKKARKIQKLFVIKKYVMAVNAMEALKKEKKHAPDDCWVDEDWRRRQESITNLESAIGFAHYPQDDD